MIPPAHIDTAYDEEYDIPPASAIAFAIAILAAAQEVTR
jgi:hypothetical protein